MADHDIHIVIAQLNFTVGDIENNTKKIIEAIKKVNDGDWTDEDIVSSELVIRETTGDVEEVSDEN